MAKLYPREIEEILYPHPDVEGVQVIGVPDQKYGEELCAWLRLRDGADPLDDERGGRSARASSPTTRSRAT